MRNQLSSLPGIFDGESGSTSSENALWSRPFGGVPEMIRSMTGFARAAGATAPFQWAWELKTVNGRGLDVRERLLDLSARLLADGV